MQNDVGDKFIIKTCQIKWNCVIKFDLLVPNKQWPRFFNITFLAKLILKQNSIWHA